MTPSRVAESQLCEIEFIIDRRQRHPFVSARNRYEMRDVSMSEDSLIEPRQIEKHSGAVMALAGVSVAVYAEACH